MRHTGIPMIGNVSWGTHFCQFYRDHQDLIDILVPYFKAGLENNEFCMWITSEPLHAEEARLALAGAVEGLEEYIRKGQIEILDYRDWYILDGKFNSHRVLQGWVDRLDAARKRGFDGLRLSGNTFWLEKSDWRNFTEYEAAIDGIIGKHPMLALCTYSLAKCGAVEIMDVVANHAFALIKRGSDWQVIESAERKRTEETLQRQREWIRVTLTSIGDAVLATGIDGLVKFLNPVAAELTGWTEQEALGQPSRKIFRIINEHTREERDDIIARVLHEGRALTLANNTMLLARDGREIPIEDSAAPIRDATGNIEGVVVVFRDVTEKRQAKLALQESEQRIRRKLESILSPDGDVGTLELRDVIDTTAIQSLMDVFHSLVQIPMAIIDTEGKVLVGVGWQEICVDFHRAHPESCKNCIESDTQLSAGIPPGECRFYKCKNQMWDVATPLIIGDRHVGNLFAGQFFFEDESPDQELFRKQAHKYGFDEERYIAALEKVPRLSRERASTGMAFMAKLGHMISLLSYSNIKLARSLSEREALTESLRKSADRLSRTQEIAHLGSWELDLQTNDLSWSDEVYRIFGLQPKEFGATYEAFLEMVHPDDRKAVNGAYSRSLLEGRDAYEITHRVVRKGTGEIRWVEERCEHIRDANGRIIRSRGMVQDITERVRSEQALREAQKLESIGVLAGGIAHDFNNLLTSILGNASLLEQDLGKSAEVQSIVGASQRAASLTRQLLAYAGKGQLYITEFDVAQLVRSSIDLIRVSIPKNIALVVDMPHEVPSVRGDSSQIQQVVMNLVINAAEAIGQDSSGKVEISVELRDLNSDPMGEVATGLVPGRYIAISVRDSGCGMDAGTRAKIFDPFFTTKFTGRGLGLAAVQGILRSHKGAICVETSPGQGSTFTVYLPCCKGKIALSSDDIVPLAEFQAATVLVVDDEEPVRAFAKTALERFGHKVLLAEDGEQAMELLRTGEEVDLVLLDLIMPVLGGAQSFKEIRSMRPNLPVLVASGYGRDQAQNLGIPGELPFLEKPYTVRELVTAIGKALESTALQT